MSWRPIWGIACGMAIKGRVGMGFSNRLRKVRDPDVPIPRRVMALCGALTHCHAGFHGGKEEIRRQFGWTIGQPASNQQLVAAADYLADQWNRARLRHDETR